MKAGYKEIKPEYRFIVYYVDKMGMNYKIREFAKIGNITKSISNEKRWDKIDIYTELTLKINNEAYYYTSYNEMIKRKDYELGVKDLIRYTIEGQKYDIFSTYF